MKWITSSALMAGNRVIGAFCAFARIVRSNPLQVNVQSGTIGLLVNVRTKGGGRAKRHVSYFDS